MFSRVGLYVRRNIVGFAALFVALSAGAYAAGLPKDSVKSKQIKAGAVKTAEIAAGAVTSAEVDDRSLLGADFAAGQLPAGADGATGPQGPAGSPDTPEQVGEKLRQVDGTGSNIDADQLDGLDSGGFVREIYSFSQTFNPNGVTAGQCTFASHAVPAGITLLNTDTLVVSPAFTGRFGFQVTPDFDVAGRVLYASMCANGEFDETSGRSG